MKETTHILLFMLFMICTDGKTFSRKSTLKEIKVKQTNETVERNERDETIPKCWGEGCYSMRGLTFGGEFFEILT